MRPLDSNKTRVKNAVQNKNIFLIRKQAYKHLYDECFILDGVELISI